MSTVRNMIINDGHRVHLQVGDELISILPANIVARGCIDKVERVVDLPHMLERVAVQFKNGHRAYLEMHLDRADPIWPDALKEFHATCIMIYDL